MANDKMKQIQLYGEVQGALANTDKALKSLVESAEMVIDFFEKRLNKEYKINAKMKQELLKTNLTKANNLDNANILTNSNLVNAADIIQKFNEKFTNINHDMLEHMVNSVFLSGQAMPNDVTAFLNQLEEEEKKIVKAGIKAREMAKAIQMLAMVIGPENLKMDVKNVQAQIYNLSQKIDALCNKNKEFKSSLVNKPKSEALKSSDKSPNPEPLNENPRFKISKR